MKPIRLFYWIIQIGTYGFAGALISPWTTIPLVIIDLLSYLDATGQLGREIRWKKEKANDLFHAD